MYMNVNVNLSDKELEMIADESIILTKATALKKVELFFSACIPEIDAGIISILTKQVNQQLQSAKISKGEQYLQMPYLILDYPRCFNKESVFAVRTMFWWGHYFSITLHLSGAMLNIFREAIAKNMNEGDWFFCIHEEQWHHHHKQDNYVPLSAINNIQEIIMQAPFVKLSRIFSLRDENLYENFCLTYYAIGKLLTA